MLLKIPDVLSREEIAKLRIELNRTQFRDGSLTGKKSLKKNLQSDQTGQQLPQLLQLVTNGLMRTDGFTMYAQPRKLHMVFNRYETGMQYGEHIDAALIGPSQDRAVRSDVSFTVFLADPSTYEGGELVMVTPYGEHFCKEPAGTVVVYPSLVLHRVEPVRSGVRLAAIGWAQSFIRDPLQREMAYEMDRLRRDLARELPDSPYLERFGRIHQNTLRMWVEN
ncbi:MAG: Fe2+-dependent dioxygenase [Alphaproteobacteria bacterium]|nr:Fe2+-dependent dioxygenase [Alphaproteobacteria bacterium]MBU0798889.1 Fe2+-dependent dioxygenase [Alphaproteobacteria bacterium]MBU0885601.1 Fe2+-dependent dioxygenase [Alphaproteobacteria bacterium]MBU1813527.1 Fe2+-dependent dioxygenase [Alphaproteobacteria bacterium]MBU2091198.1 Fe2+-dependent dioxygenase [Alphaproteobacteria bacterium]